MRQHLKDWGRSGGGFVLTDAPSLRAAAEDWNALVEGGATRHAYLRHEWFSSWWEGFGGKSELTVVGTRDARGFIALAPCHRVRRVRGVGLPWLEFMTNHEAPRCDFILREEDPAVLQALLLQLLRASTDCLAVRLVGLPGDSPSWRHLAGAASALGVRVDATTHKTSPFLDISGSWDEYVDGLARKTRRNLRRAVRKTEAAGDRVTIRSLVEPQDVRGAIPDLLQISSRSWKAQEGSDMGAHPETRCFYESLAGGSSGSGLLRAWILDIDGAPAAMQTALWRNGEVLLLRTDFDLRFSGAEVGTGLLVRVLEECFRAGCRVFDFSGAAYWYKTRLANRSREIHDVDLYPPRPASRLLYATRRLWRLMRSASRTKRTTPDDALPLPSDA